MKYGDTESEKAVLKLVDKYRKKGMPMYVIAQHLSDAGISTSPVDVRAEDARGNKEKWARIERACREDIDKFRESAQ